VIHWAWALIASISGGTGENLPTNWNQAFFYENIPNLFL
jgi:hypothetical protein